MQISCGGSFTKLAALSSNLLVIIGLICNWHTCINYEQIDMIIGVEYSNILLWEEKRFIGNLCFQKSVFGWICSGKSHGLSRSKTLVCSLISNIEKNLKKLWESEEVELKSSRMEEHESCNVNMKKIHVSCQPSQFNVRLARLRDHKYLSLVISCLV